MLPGDLGDGQCHYTCARDFYAPNASEPDVCAPCLPLVVNCPLGSYRQRCITDRDHLCVPCSYPPLPPNTTFGLRHYVYGEGFLFDECTEENIDFSRCAKHLTPQWDAGWCRIECAPGFTAASEEGPACVWCEQTCAPGFYPPACRGGAFVDTADNGGKCLPCDAHAKPAQAEWTTHCEWTCVQAGFYRQGDRCVACGVQACALSGFAFMGCRGDYAGSCRSCSLLTTCAWNQFLDTNVALEACVCASCTQPVLGQTYEARACNRTADAVLRPCTSWCASAHSYMRQECSLFADSACAPCTPPIAGQLLEAACNRTADARYGPCPSAMACNGSAYAFRCPAGTEAVHGVCVCLPGTVFLADGSCGVMNCSVQGYYPDAISGQCVACATPTTMELITTRRGVLGLQACGCVEGYFAQPASGSNTKIECWPCGDLECVPGLQRQVGCAGQVEPACACGVGPGMQLREPPSLHMEQQCRMECREGYWGDSSMMIPLGLYDRYSFLTLAGGVSAPQNLSGPILSSCRGVPVLLNEGYALALCGPLALVVLSLRTGQSEMVAADFLQKVAPSARKSIYEITALAVHDSQSVWVAFAYHAYECEGGEPEFCSTMELLSVEEDTSPTTANNNCLLSLGVCIRVHSELWGNNLVWYGTRYKITALSLTKQLQTMYMVTTTFGHEATAASLIMRYDIVFYSNNDASAVRQTDALVQVWTAPPMMRLQAVAEGLGGLYVASGASLYRLSTTTTTLSRIQWLPAASAPIQGIVALQPHLLWIEQEGGQHVMLDLWNQLSSTTTFSAMLRARPTLQVALLLLQSQQQVSLALAPALCATDTVSYDGQSCVPLHCRYLNACGPRGVRVGDACVCEPGYYMVDGECVPCASARHYCTGVGPPTPCPSPYSLTTTHVASSVSDCVCKPGFYAFGALCVACPTNMWCPVNGTLVPIACYRGGTTVANGHALPLSCVCPARTHGLTCLPCADDEACDQNIQVPVAAYMLNGWGPVWAWELLQQQCLLLTRMGEELPFLVYSVLGVTSMRAWIGVTPDMLEWNWVLVVQNPPAGLEADVTECMERHGFIVSKMELMGTESNSKIHQREKLSSRWEWDGQSGITCVGGYELLVTEKYGRVCFPCLNGSVRPRRSALPYCEFCDAPNTHAPYLGMTQCECVPGFEERSGVCYSIVQGVPWWYLNMTTSIVVAVALVLGLLAFSLFAAECLL